MRSFLPLRTGRAAWWIACVAVCSMPPSARAIEHHPGIEADHYPEAVLVTARSPGKDATCRCCGVLIDRRAVLTVAHGVVGFETWEVTAPYAKGGATTVQVQSARIHPDYETGIFENDLAVLRLADPIDLDRPLPALHRGDLLPIGARLTVVGRVDNGKPSADRLFAAEVERFWVRGDINIYGGFPRISQRGDSGGPVYPAGDGHEVVALIGGALSASRANVPTDIYIPIIAGNRKWILAQLPRPAKPTELEPSLRAER